MTRFVYHKNFKKAYKKLPKKLQSQSKLRLLMLASEPYSKTLNNHALRGSFAGCRSINVSGDIRIIYIEESDDVIMLLEIGSHSQLYK